MNSPPLFRRASASDAAVLTEIALAGKRYWGYPETWIAQWQPDLTITPVYLRAESVSLALVHGEIAGFVGLLRSEEARHLEHLWLKPEFIGRGLGRALFGEAVRLAQAESVTELRINADPNAESFYLRMGAARIGVESYLLLDGTLREVPRLIFKVPNATELPAIRVT